MTHFRIPSRFVQASAALLVVALSASLAACGDKEGAQAATQVAAKVGSEEISVHQINQVLSRSNTNGATKEAVQAASKQVLERLIDQQLAVDQATENKLHRSPEVVTQLEAMRREVLARAYIQQVIGALPKLTPEEIKKYYDENPALFAERRVFTVQEIQVPDAASVLSELRSMAEAGKPLEEVANMLKARNVKFRGGSATRAAEQIPLELLPKIHALKDGQSLVLSAGAGATFLRIDSSRQTPVTEAVATPGIEQFLNNRRSSEAVAAEIKRLRAATTVTYMGEFVKTAAAPAAAASTLSMTTPTIAAETDGNAAIERGLSGLK